MRVYHLIATLVDPATVAGQRWASSSNGSRQRANSLRKSVLIWRRTDRQKVSECTRKITVITFYTGVMLSKDIKKNLNH